MTTTINASPTNGLVQTADGSGLLKCQSNGVTTNALAWVNFNGTGTVAIRSSYNVSSITDNATGQYTVNFTTALADANYSTQLTNGYLGSGEDWVFMAEWTGKSTTSLPIRVVNSAAGTYLDSDSVNVAIFGN